MKLFIFSKFTLILSLAICINGNEDCLATEGDPCDTDLVLTDWHRSIRYDTESGFIISDDFIIDGWYKLRNEGDRIDIRMPTSSPGLLKCGTLYPVWIDGTYPALGDEVKTVTGCVPTFTGACGYSIDLCLKACSTEDDDSYFVHYLIDTPGTSMGYCTDSQIPCDGNTTSSTGFPPCYASFPKFNEEPTLTFEAEDIGISAVCNINSAEVLDEIDYFVRWFIDDEMVYDEMNRNKISDEYNKATTTGCEDGLPHQCILNSRLGSNIQCEVSLKFKDQDAFSPGVRSNTFYAGLTIEPNNTVEFVIGVNELIEFNVSSTIPIVGGSVYHDICDKIFHCPGVKVIIKAETNGEGAVVKESCHKEITSDSPATFTISGTKNVAINYLNKANYIEFVGDQTTFSSVSNIWKGRLTNFPTFKVIAKGVNPKQCKGTGDPHYTTFDGWYYHIYKTGYYLFYEHNTLPIKVQTRLSVCGGVSCACGVAAQVGHTHLIVDRCNNAGNTYTIFKATHDGVVKEVRTSTNTKVTTAEILKDGERTPGASLSYSNGQFLISLPTGSFIRIILFGSHYIHIFLTGSWDDFENVKGLCGNFDNDKTNDGHYGPDPDYECGNTECEPTTRSREVSNAFSNSWSVNNDDNIFMGKLYDGDTYPIDSFCTCGEDGFECGYCNGLNAENNNLGCGNNRRKKAVEEIDLDDQAGNYEFTDINDDPDFEPQVPTFPTAGNGFTEEYTRKLCTETLLNSTTYEVCLDAINNGSITIDDIIDGCIIDILVTDDASIAKQTITELQDSCQLELTTNPQYWEVSENGTIALPTELLGKLCVNECNNNGECINGTCECIEGFGGSDCSISLAEPPLVFAVLGDGLCDVSSRPCRSAKVYGENFDERGNITCHIQNINVSEIGITLLPETSIVSGIFRTDQEVKCPLPEPAVQPDSPGEGVVASGYLISISNDGELKSEEMAILIVYDSVCQVCNASEGECYLKNNSCNINGHCYAAFDVNTEDCCQQCLPDLSVDTWITRQDDTAPIMYTSNPYPAIHQDPITFAFDIEDPEGCGIIFSKQNGDEDATLSETGEFNWTPVALMSNHKSVFEIHMQDKCGFSATFNFSVDVCKCENGQECAFVNGSSLYECVTSETSEETPKAEGTHSTSFRTENTIMSTANVNDPVSTPTHIVSESSSVPASSITESTYADVTFLEKGTIHSTSDGDTSKQTTIYEIYTSTQPSITSGSSDGDTSKQTTIQEIDTSTQSSRTSGSSDGDTSKQTTIQEIDTSTQSSITLGSSDGDTSKQTNIQDIDTSTQPSITSGSSDGDTSKQTNIQDIDTSAQPSITSGSSDGDTSKQTTIQDIDTSAQPSTTSGSSDGDTSKQTNIQDIDTSAQPSTTSGSSDGDTSKQTTIQDIDTSTQPSITSGSSDGDTSKQTTIQDIDTSTQPSITSGSSDGDTSKQTTIQDIDTSTQPSITSRSSDGDTSKQTTIQEIDTSTQPSITSGWIDGDTSKQTTIQEIDTSTQPSITSGSSDGDTSKQTTIQDIDTSTQPSITLGSSDGDTSKQTTIQDIDTSTQPSITSGSSDGDTSKQTTIQDIDTSAQPSTTSGSSDGDTSKQTNIQDIDTSTQPSITSRSSDAHTSKQTTVVNVPERETTVSMIMTTKSKTTTSNVMASHDFKTVDNTDASTGTKATERLTAQGTQYYTSSPNPSSSSSHVLTTHTKSTSGHSTSSVRTNSYDEPTVLQDDRTDVHGLTTLGRTTTNDVTSKKKYITSFKSTPQTDISSEEPHTNEHIFTEPVTEAEIKLTTFSGTVDNYFDYAVLLQLKGLAVSWLTVKEVFRIGVMRAMNTYCLLNAASCCDWTETNRKNTLNEDITSIGQIKLTDETIDNNQIDIVMSVGYKDYSNTCFQNNGERQKRDSTNNKKHSISRRDTVANEYISAKVVKSAIEQEKESIEAAIQMEIIDVSLYSEEKDEKKPGDDESYTVFILIGVCCFMVIIVFGFAFGVYKWHHRQNQNSYMSSKIISISSSPSPTISTDASNAISSGSLNGMMFLKGSRAGTPTSINAWN